MRAGRMEKMFSKMCSQDVDFENQKATRKNWGTMGDMEETCRNSIISISRIYDFKRLWNNNKL